MAMLVVLLLLSSFAGHYFVAGLPDGPSVPGTCMNFTPIHNDTQPSADIPPVNLNLTGLVAGAYELTTTITVTLQAFPNITFEGFMMQVRDNNTSSTTPLGTFSSPNNTKIKTVQCTQAEDTVGHANQMPVNSVAVDWTASQLPENITSIIFYYTVVESYSRFWVQLQSEAISIRRLSTTTSIPPANTNLPTTMQTTAPTNESTSETGTPLKRKGTADILVRLHASLMVFAWGLLAPVGIMLALFYKAVWPRGQWFYSHIGMMIGTLVFSGLGVIPIVVHADGRWLNTTINNFPHQILGLAALGAVGINPFLAICRCQQNSSWRWIYNWIHGSTGLILGEGAAFGAMLLGLQIVRHLAGVNEDYVHYAIYSVSATIGLIIMIAALSNIYTINYTKSHPTIQDLGVTSEPPEEFPERKARLLSSTLNSRNDKDDDDDYDEYDDDEDEPSKDHKCRETFGLLVTILLLAAAVTNITLFVIL